jgi:hypothetical protein
MISSWSKGAAAGSTASAGAATAGAIPATAWPVGDAGSVAGWGGSGSTAAAALLELLAAGS